MDEGQPLCVLLVRQTLEVQRPLDGPGGLI
jgi:hypothetical protein